MTTRKIVREILKNHPKTRNSDKLLLLVYIQLYGQGVGTSQFVVEHFDFIRDFIRERARIQNKEWPYKACNEIQDKRGIKEEEYRQEFSPLNVTTVGGGEVKEEKVRNTYSLVNYLNIILYIFLRRR